MKLKLTFKSASKRIKSKVIEVDAEALISLLNDEAVLEIFGQLRIKDYVYSGFYLHSITDND